MDNMIENIINGINVEELIIWIKKKIYENGPSDSDLIEMLTYLKYYQKDIFRKYEQDILEIMGVFYKNNEIRSVKGLIMSLYHEEIKQKYNQNYTPIQANIIDNIINNKYFSFSAPTSSGKSYVFRELIKESTKDIIIIVPTRALINEYYIRVCELITDKKVNILTYVEIINTKYSNRNIFILTPERAKELFKHKDILNIEMILFDEAQLGDEDNTRGIFFDSIIRRIERNFPNAKKLFAHPFISNPEAQLKKNNIYNSDSSYYKYSEKTVGQMYVSYENNDFYHFGINKKLMGSKKVKMNEDPIKKILKDNGSILIYTTKSSIYSGAIYKKFNEYIRMCADIEDEEARKLISELKDLIGGSENKSNERYSQMIAMLKKGIISHHGSLPLKARIILEEFTQKGFCRICFSTSTLVQGINMPFDAVWLELFEGSKPLNMRNLIGRAGRSTTSSKFDYGIVIVKDSNKSKFREIMTKNIEIKEKSNLDIQVDGESYEIKEFKEAVLNNEISDEYNLSKKEINRLTEDDINIQVEIILQYLILNNKFITPDVYSAYSKTEKNKVKKAFETIFSKYLNGRELSSGEKTILSTSIRILIWQINGKTFKQIVGYRYAYITRIKERKERYKERYKEMIDIEPKFTMECTDIPNSSLKSYNMFANKKVNEVKYDRIVFDTYDYIDKIIGFKMKDIYYATFKEYYIKTGDERANKMALYLKYGTIEDREIMLLKYGFSFETIEWLYDYIEEINEEYIKFRNIENLDCEKRKEIERYIN